MAYDTKCEVLARFFLAEEGFDEDELRTLTPKLAQDIQNNIEEFIANELDNEENEDEYHEPFTG